MQAQAERAGLPLTLNTVAPDAIHAFLSGLDKAGIDEAAYQRQARWLLQAEFDQQTLRRRLAHGLQGDVHRRDSASCAS